MRLGEMQERVLAGVGLNGGETRRLGAALGQVLAADVVSPHDYPLFDNSAMDGFALRAGDVTSLPATLEVIGVSSAGHPFAGPVRRGQAARILTGAPLVPGADCVVPVEATESGDGNTVRVLEVPAVGAHVRPRGEIVSAGATVLSTGTRLNPGHLGFLASLGIPAVEVVRLPRVAVLSTGDELVAPDDVPGPGQIFESNTVLLVALLERFGCPVRVVHARDDRDSLARTLDQLCAEVDVIISTGGVSMGGEYDALRNAVAHHAVDVVQVAIKPAKPFAFGHVGEAVMFGLPGNPASVVVSFESFVRPALRRMAGIEPVAPPVLQGTLAQGLTRPDDGKIHFLPMRTTADGGWERAGAFGSHAVSPFAAAAAMLALHPEGPDLEPGAPVQLIPLWT